jgi:hypothetical protein
MHGNRRRNFLIDELPEILAETLPTPRQFVKICKIDRRRGERCFQQVNPVGGHPPTAIEVTGPACREINAILSPM